MVGYRRGVGEMVKRCYHYGYKLTPATTYSLFNTGIGKVVAVCKDCHTAHLRMRAKQRKRTLPDATSNAHS